MASGYTWDAIDFKDEWGAQVQYVRGNLGFPARKEPTEYDWSDEDGVQAFTDEDDIQFAARDITLKCYIKGTTETKFHARLTAIRNSMAATGLHDLKLKHDLNTHRVYYKAGDPVEILGGWNNSTNVGEFFLKFREPKPAYPAIWRSLVGHWLLDKPARAWPGGAVPTKYLGTSQTDIVNNGTFTGSATGWTLTGNVAYGSNNVVFTADGASTTYMYNVFSTAGTSGKRYRLTYEITQNSLVGSGLFRMMGGAYSSAVTIYDGANLALTHTVGTHSVEFTARSSSTCAREAFDLTTGYTSGTLTVDNISITQIGCVAQYEDTKSAATWADASGNTLNATVSGASLVTDPSTISVFGSVYSFDGSNDNIYVADNAKLDMGTGDFALFGLIKTDTVAAGTDYIFYKKSGATGYALSRVADDLMLTVGASNYITTSNLIAANSWQAIAVSADRNGNASFYVNGAAAGTKSITGTSLINISNAATFYIGKPSGGLAGDMDRALIFADVIPASVVRLLSLGIKDEKLANFPALYNFAASPWTTDRKSASNAAIDFDGTDDYADTGDPFQSTFRDSFSISMWVKPDDGIPASAQYLFGVLDTTDPNSAVRLFIDNSGKLNFIYQSEGNSGNTATTAAAVFANGAETWHHIIVTIDKDTKKKKIYFDGVSRTLDSTSDGGMTGVTMSSFTSVRNPYVGAYNSAGTAANFFAGAIVDVRLYSKTLSAEEVNLLYYTYSTGAGSFDTPS